MGACEVRTCGKEGLAVSHESPQVSQLGLQSVDL